LVGQVRFDLAKLDCPTIAAQTKLAPEIYNNKKRFNTHKALEPWQKCNATRAELQLNKERKGGIYGCPGGATERYTERPIWTMVQKRSNFESLTSSKIRTLHGYR